MLTSEHVCNTIGTLIGNILRKEELPEEKIVRMTIFLVEAVNIELFLYTRLYPELQNFEGKVYRGVTTSVEDYSKFKKLMETDVLENRVISVPLSLWSSSKLIQIPEGFMDLRNRPNCLNIMLVIHVINLDPEDLKFY
jgi:hypothetical protein